MQGAERESFPLLGPPGEVRDDVGNFGSVCGKEHWLQLEMVLTLNTVHSLEFPKIFSRWTKETDGSRGSRNFVLAGQLQNLQKGSEWTVYTH